MFDSESEIQAVTLSSRAEAEHRAAVWRAWRAFFETSARLQNETDAVLRAGVDISISDYNVLLLLYEAEDHRLRFRDIARGMAFSKSRLSYQIKVLTKRGLVSRHSVEGDARGVFIQITDLGLETFVRAGRLHERHVDSLILDLISIEEAEVVERVFSRIAKRVAQPWDAPGRGLAELCAAAAKREAECENEECEITECESGEE